MKRQIRLLAAVLSVALILAPLPVSAQGAMHVTGGGTGTFGADLDGDGDIDGSQFGMALIIQGSTAMGHFMCLMAGRSDILGLPLMAVEGQVDGASANLDGSVSFSGTARVNLANGQIFEGVPFAVLDSAGGPGTGTLQLTVIGAFDGVPGDTNPGNGNYDLPPETVNSGQINIH